MKKWIYTLFLLSLISCTKYPDPEVKLLEGYYFNQINNNQVSMANSVLEDSIGLFVSAFNNLLVGNYYIEFDVTKGGGNVNPSAVDIKNGFATTNWQLGSETNEQQLMAKLYDSNHQFIHEVPLSAYGFRENVWDTVFTSPFVSFREMVSDSISGEAYGISYGKLWKQGEPYYAWSEDQSALNINPYSIELDSKGNVYLLASQNYLYVSNESKTGWKQLSTEVSGQQLYCRFEITSDDVMWIAAYGYPISYSTDNGDTWNMDTTGLEGNYMIQDIGKLSNGNYILLNNALQIFTLNLETRVWQRMTTPGSPLKLYVTDSDEVILVSQLPGISILKSTDFGETYVEKKPISPEYITSGMENTILKYANTYYVLIPGWGVLETEDFESFKTYYKNAKVNNIFVDKDGNLYANGAFNEATAYILAQ